MCKQLFTAFKLVYLLTLLCYSFTSASPLSAAALKKIVENNAANANLANSKSENVKPGGNAAVGSVESSANILSYSNDNDGLGSYKFEYDTQNNIHQKEEGNLKQIGNVEAIVAAGSYEYLGPHGEKVSVVYTADENGYRPKVYITLINVPSPSPPVVAAPPELVASLVG